MGLKKTQAFYQKALKGLPSVNSKYILHPQREVLGPLNILALGLKKEFDIEDETLTDAPSILNILYQKGNITFLVYEIFLAALQTATLMKNHYQNLKKNENSTKKLSGNPEIHLLKKIHLLRGLIEERLTRFNKSGKAQFEERNPLDFGILVYSSGSFGREKLLPNLPELISNIIQRYKSETTSQSKIKHLECMVIWLNLIKELHQTDESTISFKPINHLLPDKSFKYIIFELHQFILKQNILPNADAEILTQFLKTLNRLRSQINLENIHAYELALVKTKIFLSEDLYWQLDCILVAALNEVYVFENANLTVRINQPSLSTQRTLLLKTQKQLQALKKIYKTKSPEVLKTIFNSLIFTIQDILSKTNPANQILIDKKTVLTIGSKLAANALIFSQENAEQAIEHTNLGTDHLNNASIKPEPEIQTITIPSYLNNLLDILNKISHVTNNDDRYDPHIIQQFKTVKEAVEKETPASKVEMSVPTAYSPMFERKMSTFSLKTSAPSKTTHKRIGTAPKDVSHSFHSEKEQNPNFETKEKPRSSSVGNIDDKPRLSVADFIASLANNITTKKPSTDGGKRTLQQSKHSASERDLRKNTLKRSTGSISSSNLQLPAATFHSATKYLVQNKISSPNETPTSTQPQPPEDISSSINHGSPSAENPMPDHSNKNSNSGATRKKEFIQALKEYIEKLKKICIGRYQQKNIYMENEFLDAGLTIFAKKDEDGEIYLYSPEMIEYYLKIYRNQYQSVWAQFFTQNQDMYTKIVSAEQFIYTLEYPHQLMQFTDQFIEAVLDSTLGNIVLKFKDQWPQLFIDAKNNYEAKKDTSLNNKAEKIFPMDSSKVLLRK